MTRTLHGVNMGTIGVMKHEVRVYNDLDEDMEDDLRPEYDFDYSKAKPNPYAAEALRRRAVASEGNGAEVEIASVQGDVN